jgi:hypothetical protein
MAAYMNEALFKPQATTWKYSYVKSGNNISFAYLLFYDLSGM